MTGRRYEARARLMVAGELARFIRDELQAQIDDWHEARAGQRIDQADCQAFLREVRPYGL